MDLYLKLATFFLAVVISGGVIIWRAQKRTKKPQIKRKVQRRDLSDLLSSNDWEKVGKIKNIWIYPIKSCAGIALDEVLIEKTGPKMAECRDRCFIIVDKDGQMITARKVSSTLLLTTDYDASNNSITLNFPNLQPIKLYLSLIEIEGKLVDLKVWNDDVSGFDCGNEAADWLSLALGRNCRLVYHGSVASKRSTQNWMDKFPLMNPDDNSLYADLAGVMLMNEASILDLEMKTSRKLPPQNFRPNILTEGPPAFDEDDWTFIKIGEAVFRNVKPCDRCFFTTINYKTGKHDEQMEPLRTLKKFRCPSGTNVPQCGINLGIDKCGKIKVEDDVLILRN